MSARLDDDVLEAIFDQLATPTWRLNEYRAKKATLANVCLASWRLCRLAQPRLWRHVCIDQTPEQAERIRTSPGLATFGGQTTTCAVIDSVFGSSTFTDQVAGVAALLPNVVDLWIKYWSFSSTDMGDASLPALGAHTKLRRVCLTNIDFADSPPVTLPHLELLEIINCVMPPVLANEWLQPSCLPLARVLSLMDVKLPAGGPINLARFLSPPFLQQLDYVETDVQQLDPEANLGCGNSPPFLFARAAGDSGALPRHSLHAPVSRMTAVDTLRYLHALASDLKHASSTGAELVVVLPHSLTSRAIDETEIAEGLAAVEAAAANTTRVFRDGDSRAPSAWMTKAVSPGFWAYARELRVARQEV